MKWLKLQKGICWTYTKQYAVIISSPIVTASVWSDGITEQDPKGPCSQSILVGAREHEGKRTSDVCAQLGCHSFEPRRHITSYSYLGYLIYELKVVKTTISVNLS